MIKPVHVIGHPDICCRCWARVYW